MTAVTLTAPFSPAPAQTANIETYAAAALQAVAASDTSNTSRDAGSASDQSGSGAGNGTGTGGSQIAMLIDRKRDEMQVQDATSKSVVEARAETDLASAFLERKAVERARAEAAAEARAADQAQARADAARMEAERAAQISAMPDPLPTAPILQRNA
jgi:hypothetical protein